MRYFTGTMSRYINLITQLMLFSRNIQWLVVHPTSRNIFNAKINMKLRSEKISSKINKRFKKLKSITVLRCNELFSDTFKTVNILFSLKGDSHSPDPVSQCQVNYRMFWSTSSVFEDCLKLLLSESESLILFFPLHNFTN